MAFNDGKLLWRPDGVSAGSGIGRPELAHAMKLVGAISGVEADSKTGVAPGKVGDFPCANGLGLGSIEDRVWLAQLAFNAFVIDERNKITLQQTSTGRAAMEPGYQGRGSCLDGNGR